MGKKSGISALLLLVLAVAVAGFAGYCIIRTVGWLVNDLHWPWYVPLAMVAVVLSLSPRTGGKP